MTPLLDPEEAALARSNVISNLIGDGHLWRVYDVNGCPACFTPRRTPGLSECTSCREVVGRNPLGLDSLDVVTLSTPREGLEPLAIRWKDAYGGGSNSDLHKLAAPLSAYLETHSDALGLSSDVLITDVPSSSALIRSAMNLCRTIGWYDVEMETVGGARDPGRKQRHLEQDVRRRLTRDDWVVDEEAVGGRETVLIDDVMTSGASLHSYASALKLAGAWRIRGLVLIRNIGGTVYQEVLQAEQRADATPWSREQRSFRKLSGLG